MTASLTSQLLLGFGAPIQGKERMTSSRREGPPSPRQLIRSLHCRLGRVLVVIMVNLVYMI
jgi:hypothetical protein